MDSPAKEYFYRSKLGNKFFIQEWGNKDLPPVVFIHGFPGCGNLARLMRTSELGQQLHLIAIDRPGYGKSDRQKNMTPMSFAHQVREIIEDLNIGNFRLMSVSGGAPYAMALAHLMKDQVLKISSVGGVAPLSLENFKFLNQQQLKAWALATLVPDAIVDSLLQRIFRTAPATLEKFFFSEVENGSGPDRAVFCDPVLGPFILDTLKEALVQGPGGITDDMLVYTKNWGYDLQQISCPVTLWHGNMDDVVSPMMAMSLGRHLPKTNLKIVPNEGHYSLPMNYRDQIIKDLLAED